VGRVEEDSMSIIQDDLDGSANRGLVSLADAGADASALDAVDLAALEGFAGMQAEGEPDLIVELIDLYLEDAPRKVVSMLRAVAEADGEAMKRAAHGLKGSSASLGACRVAALCGELERGGGDDSFERAGALLARLGQELERARQAFAAERRRRS
jgi:two-component system, sensor histidine kinase and response regulator